MDIKTNIIRGKNCTDGIHMNMDIQANLIY